MKNNSLNDCCFLIASSAKKSYQKLSETYAAIEPPTWALCYWLNHVDRWGLKYV